MIPKAKGKKKKKNIIDKWDCIQIKSLYTTKIMLNQMNRKTNRMGEMVVNHTFDQS
jgi:hypothetical protein